MIFVTDLPHPLVKDAIEDLLQSQPNHYHYEAPSLYTISVGRRYADTSY